MSDLPIGAYVLATKFSDGDPCDQFAVGFISGKTPHGRWLVIDQNGVNMRANGFRRAERITPEEGAYLVSIFPMIGDNPGASLWWHLDKYREEQDA